METLIQECHSVSNVTILCQDGLMNTHKIIMAGISDFIKSILAEIPVGDQVTLFMPDFRAEDIERFLHINMKGCITDQNVDLARAFGINPQIPDGNVRIKIIAENLKRECDEIDDKDVLKFLKIFTDINIDEIEKIKNNNINELKVLGHDIKLTSSMNRVYAILVDNCILYGGADKVEGAGADTLKNDVKELATECQMMHNQGMSVSSISSCGDALKLTMVN